MNSNLNRRNFARAVSVAGLSAVSYQRVASAAAAGPRPVVAIIGCGGRAKSLTREFENESEIGWVCDPDRQRADELQAKHRVPEKTTDFRRVLDDKHVDAVSIATPDHWHAPAAILACDAGKHVYVEKPCSHNLREGRLLVQSAERNNVVVQHGTQSRNHPLIAGAMKMLSDGLIGEVLMAKGWNIQRRKNIGHASPSQTPSQVDYETWVGPAEFIPFQSNRFHYNWHWWHNFGTGDIGNDGAHEIDIARWGLGASGLPNTASAIGGKYYFDDDQQFPDTATCAFEWDGPVGHRKQLVFEMRIWSKNLPYNCDTGIEFYGTRGMMFLSKRGKLQVWDEGNRPVKDLDPEGAVTINRSHQGDFLQAITDGNKPAADIRIAHDSCALIHLANISIRTRRGLTVDRQQEQIKNDIDANRLLARTYRDGGHWSVPRNI